MRGEDEEQGEAADPRVRGRPPTILTPEISPRPPFPAHPMPMSSDARTAQHHLTPEERRDLLRAFADRMLLKITAMDDPEDMPGVERAVRTAAVIERLYSRCDRAERCLDDPHKRRAERARHAEEAFKAQASLAHTLKWSDKTRRSLGKWWDAAEKAAEAPRETPPAKPPVTPQAACVDNPGAIDAAHLAPGLPPLQPEPREAR